MTRDELNALCREVYGIEKWASVLASDISKVGRQTAPATVNHWQSGERVVPDWVEETLVTAWHARALRLQRTAVHTRAVADRIAASLAPEIDDDLAPRM